MSIEEFPKIFLRISLAFSLIKTGKSNLNENTNPQYLLLYCKKKILLQSKKIWQIKILPPTLRPVLCDSLIKKGRGIWPDDALAT
jgi:hypothetical protein